MTQELSKSTDNPRLAVIIPVYNVEKYLPKCLDSIINQTYKSLQIICVDDGSPDNCGAILDDYAKIDTRVTVIHKANGGLSSARNVALEKLCLQWQKDPYSCSPFVTFVDPDDCVEECAFELLLNYFQQGVDAVFYGHEKIYENERNGDDKPFYGPGTIGLIGKYDVTNDINIKSPCFVTTIIFKTSIISSYNLRFPEGCLYEDIYFKTIYMFYCSSVWFDDTYFYKYLLRLEAITSINNRGKKNYAVHRMHICNRLLKYLKQNEFFESKKDVFWYLFYSAVSHAVNDCHKDELEQVYTEAEKIINEENNSNITILQRHINELVKIKDLRESTKYKAAKILKIKHRVDYDKYYVFFLPIAKISYTDKAKYIQLFGIFKIKLE
ncbi:MAG: glycosyltransferase [Anaerobiospirillum succiniciproducens]|uniref:glycosyltransferase n=1 Tax=Anaerobiospirillum succiniciproducens TaxID=13335 RepID=UPI002A7627B9|nr:glycosyltransferase [Anaerobiospirillum succiniciproducens]MDY2798472.1 glycosyltransferase [Anaerobiospirillum succiniciproducens]